MSSSESESENIKLFNSAIDHDFISDILKKGASSSEKVLPSLRPKEKDNTYELKVTPGFQKHIAKHLDAIIQKNIKEVTYTTPTSNETESNGGITLFSHSKSQITKSDLENGLQEQMPSFKRRRKRKVKKSSDSESSEEERQRISSAAVSPEWVLKKMGDYGKCMKGKVVKLKDAGNGQLIEVECDE